MAKKTLVFLLASILFISLSVFSVSAEVSESIDFFYSPGVLIVDNALAGQIYNGGVGSLVTTSFEFLPNYQVRPGVVYDRAARVANIYPPVDGDRFTYGDNILTTVTTSFRSIGLFSQLPSYNTVHFNFWQVWNAEGLEGVGKQLTSLRINGQVIPRNCYAFTSSTAGGYTSVFSLAVNLTDEVATLITQDKDRPYESIELVLSTNFENSEPMTLTQSFNIYSRISEVTFTNLELDQALLEAQRQTQLLGDIANKLDNIDQKFDQAMQEHDEQQKQEYNQQGNDQSAGIDNAIPSVDQALTALGSFVNAISTESREAYFPTPKLALPKIDGVTDKEIVFLEASNVKVSSYVEQLPPQLLLAIQLFVTISLCLFLIHEVMTSIDAILNGSGRK